MDVTFRGARLVDATSDLPRADLAIGAGRIQTIRPTPDAAEEHDAARGGPILSIDASELVIAPGFIDVHSHGGGGFSLHTADPGEIAAYARWVAHTGVTGFLAGIVGEPGELPGTQLRAAATAARRSQSGCSSAETLGAEVLGIHLEGPYISPRRRGAHLASWLRLPHPAETERLLELADGQLRLLTIAPELEGAPELVRRMVAAGVTVSIGHTDATYDEARAAIALGATHATHCCNAMRPLHHREPGPLAAIVEAGQQVRGELIADGVHLHPAMVRLLVELLGTERAVVITDALAPAGVAEGEFAFNGQRAAVAGGAIRLADGTLAGSVLAMDQALRNVLAMTGVSLCAAVGMLTRNPLRSAGVAERKGQLAAGYDADLVLLDRDLQVQATLRGGALIYATDSWRERLATLAPGR